MEVRLNAAVDCCKHPGNVHHILLQRNQNYTDMLTINYVTEEHVSV